MVNLVWFGGVWCGLVGMVLQAKLGKALVAVDIGFNKTQGFYTQLDSKKPAFT
jgi:hypothetical protein